MNLLPNDKMKILSRKWCDPDSRSGYDWTYDGVRDTPDHWMGYNHELREGLGFFNCKSFDDLVLYIGKQLHYNPDVIDLMGGAYFLEDPENTNTLTGIRVHDKDQDYLVLYSSENTAKAHRVRKIISAPNRSVIVANILTIKDWVRIHATAPAHILICRPVGVFDNQHAMANHFDNPKTYCKFYEWLFKNAQKLLHQNSIFFTEIPDVFEDQDVLDFFEMQDAKNHTITNIYFVPDGDYNRNGYQRRYAVIRHGIFI